MPLLLPLSQGAAGIALVIGLALLGTRQVAAAVHLLCVQSLAVTIAALALQEPVIAALTLLVNAIGATWVLRRMMPGFGMIAEPLGSPQLGILGGAALAVLSQAHGDAAQPFAVLLLALLLAATRRHSMVHLAALIAAQNAGALAAVRAGIPPLLVGPSFLVPVLFAGALGEDRLRLACFEAGRRLRRFLGWGHVMVAVLLLMAALAAPLDGMGAIIAPLTAGWGIAIAWAERRRRRGLPDRIADLVHVAAMLMALAGQAPWIALPALTVAGAAALFPTVRRRLDALKLTCLGGSVALFGLYAMPLEEPAIAFGALIFGVAAIVGMVPGLAAVAGTVLLRLSLHGPWSPAASPVLSVLCVTVMLAAGVTLLLSNRGNHPATLLRIVQAAMIGIALTRPETQGAAWVLILLLIVTEAAMALVRYDDPAAAGKLAATAALAGVPPLGLFPGLILLIAGLAPVEPWLLAPVGVASAGAMWAGLPRTPLRPSRLAMPSITWLPIAAPIAACLALSAVDPVSMLHWLAALLGGMP
ncbi:hypothetical protein [Rhodopila sp.]|uniref:hypothetical protein n=1 Tax=Rhodopila sp. TaxID=2480087 RepID=UPI002BAFA224|nr:hypothetical protein [Rhodopila sp.]HVZ07356.1 hypothetical protein [Rhodopila sp.]